MESTTLFMISIAALIVIMFCTIIAFVLYSGLFTSIVIGAGSPPIQKVTIAYKFGKGPYKDTGANFTEVTSIAPNHKNIGIYYDDPYQVIAYYKPYINNYFKLRFRFFNIINL